MSTTIVFEKCKYNAQIPTCSQHKTERDGRSEGFRLQQIQRSKLWHFVCTYCRRTRHVDNLDTFFFFQRPSSFCFNKLEKTAQWTAAVKRVGLLPWSRGGIQSDVIFPTTHCSLDSPSHQPSIIISVSPWCNLIRLDCPLATSPSSHVVLCPPTPPPPPFFFMPSPPEWKWSDWCPATPYHCAAVPLQLVASAMSYSQINQSEPCCAHWSLSLTSNTVRH